MLADRPAPIRRTSLEQVIRQQILRRTWGRIRGLAVDTPAGSLHVRGIVPSYYTKQLALLAIQEVLGPDDLARLELDIRVQPCSGLAVGETRTDLQGPPGTPAAPLEQRQTG